MVEGGQRVAAVDEQFRFILDDVRQKFLDFLLVGIALGIERILVDETGWAAAAGCEVGDCFGAPNQDAVVIIGYLLNALGDEVIGFILDRSWSADSSRLLV